MSGIIFIGGMVLGYLLRRYQMTLTARFKKILDKVEGDT